MGKLRRIQAGQFIIGAQAAADLGSAKCLNVVLLGAAVRSKALGLTEEDIGKALEARLPEKLLELNRKALMYTASE